MLIADSSEPRSTMRIGRRGSLLRSLMYTHCHMAFFKTRVLGVEIWRRTHSRKSSCATLTLIAPRFELLKALPIEMRVLLPLDENLDLQQQCIELLKLTSDDFDLLIVTGNIRGHKLTRPLALDLLGVGDNADQWTCFLNNCPELAPRFWTDELWGSSRSIPRPASLDTSEFLNPFIDKLLQYPRLFLWIVPDWGRLFANCPEREKEVRKALRHLTAQPREIASFYSVSSKFHGFRLDLPEEAPILPHVVDALCWWVSTQSGGWHHIGFAPVSVPTSCHTSWWSWWAMDLRL